MNRKDYEKVIEKIKQYQLNQKDTYPKDKYKLHDEINKLKEIKQEIEKYKKKINDELKSVSNDLFAINLEINFLFTKIKLLNKKR